MKKSFMSISMLVVSISMLALFLCSSAVSAQTSSKFVYNKSENAETVYSLDKSGKYLTPKLKYEYSKDAQGKGGVKKAYRWSEGEQKWVPYYLISMSESGNNSIVEYAAWDSKTQDFSLNPQKAVYSKGLEMKFCHTCFINGIRTKKVGKQTSIYCAGIISQWRPIV